MRFTRTLGALLLLALPVACELIDRIAVIVETDVTTLSEVMQEARVTAFLNGEDADLSPRNLGEIARRMANETLLRRDMQLTRFPQPSSIELDAMVSELVKTRFRNEDGYRAELARYGITDLELRQRLMRQASLLRYIDFRFKPEVQLSETEIRIYYEETILPELRKRGITPEPSYDDARSQAEEALTAREVDSRVETWLRDARGRTRIEFKEDAFQ